MPASRPLAAAARGLPGLCLQALPLFAGPGHVVVGTDGRRRCGERPDYPGLCAVRLPAGNHRLEVQLTTFSSLLGG